MNWPDPDHKPTDAEEAWLFEVVGLPRGAGDPDVYGYPGQDEVTDIE